MTIRISSVIRRSKIVPVQTWIVSTEAYDPEAHISARYVAATVEFTSTWPDALKLASKQQDQIAIRLMDEVHADRLRRRDAAIRRTYDEVPS